MNMNTSDPDQQNSDFDFYALLRFRALALAILGMCFMVRSSFPGLPSPVHFILDYPAVKILLFIGIIAAIFTHLGMTLYVLTRVGLGSFFLRPQFSWRNLKPVVQVASVILTLEFLLLLIQLILWARSRS